MELLHPHCAGLDAFAIIRTRSKRPPLLSIFRLQSTRKCTERLHSGTAASGIFLSPARPGAHSGSSRIPFGSDRDDSYPSRHSPGN